MKLNSLVLLRHSLRWDTLSATQLVNLLELLLDDEQDLIRLDQISKFQHIHNYSPLWQLLVKCLVKNKCLDRYMDTINDANLTKVQKIFIVLTQLSKENLSYVNDFVESIKDADRLLQATNSPQDGIVAIIDPGVVQFNQLSYKLCYLLAKYLFRILQQKYNVTTKNLKFIIHTSPYKRCLQSLIYLIENLQRLYDVAYHEAPSNLTFTVKCDNFLSDHYYKDYLNKKHFTENGFLVDDVLLDDYDSDKIQSKIIKSNETLLTDAFKNMPNASYKFNWNKDLFGKHGDFNHGTLNNFTNRCLKGACSLIDFYGAKSDIPNTANICLVMTHGGLINNYLNNYANAANQFDTGEKPLEYKFIEIPPCSFIFLQSQLQGQQIATDSTVNNNHWSLEYSNINFSCFKKAIATDNLLTYAYDKPLNFDIFRRLPDDYLTAGQLDSNCAENYLKDEDYIFVKKNNSSSSTLVNPLSEKQLSTRSRKNTILTTLQDGLVNEEAIIKSAALAAARISVSHEANKAGDITNIGSGNNDDIESFYTFNQSNSVADPNAAAKALKEGVVFEKAVSLKMSLKITNDDEFYRIPNSNFSQDNVVSSAKDKRNNNNELKSKLSSYKLNWDAPTSISSSKSFQESSDKARNFSPAAPDQQRRRSRSAAFYFASDDEYSGSESDGDDSNIGSSDSASVTNDVSRREQNEGPLSPLSKPSSGEFNISAIREPVEERKAAMSLETDNASYEQHPVGKRINIVDNIAESFKELRRNDGNYQAMNTPTDNSEYNLAEDYLGLNKNYSEDEEEEDSDDFNGVYVKPNKSTGHIASWNPGKASISAGSAEETSSELGIDSIIVPRNRFETISLPLQEENFKGRSSELQKESNIGTAANENNLSLVKIDNSQNSSYSSFEARTPDDNGSPLTVNNMPLYEGSTSMSVTANPTKRRKSNSNDVNVKPKIILIKNTNSYKSLNIGSQGATLVEPANPRTNTSTNANSIHSELKTKLRLETKRVENNHTKDEALKSYFSSPDYDNFFESLNSSVGGGNGEKRHKSPVPVSRTRMQDAAHDNKENKIIFVSNSNETKHHKIY